MTPVRFLLLSSVLFSLFLLSPGSAGAQEFDLFEDEACKEDPNSEDCICAKVWQLQLQPLSYTRDYTGDHPFGVLARSVDGVAGAPKFNTEKGVWEGGGPADDPDSIVTDLDSIVRDPPGVGVVTSADGDLILVSNDHYNQQCSLSYFRENLRRLWRFGVALGAVLAAASVAWAGMVWMQESASGNDIARSRGMIIRVVIGVIVLSCSFLVWEGLADLLAGHLATWTGERTTFYRPISIR